MVTVTRLGCGLVSAETREFNHFLARPYAPRERIAANQGLDISRVVVSGVYAAGVVEQLCNRDISDVRNALDGWLSEYADHLAIERELALVEPGAVLRPQ